MTIAEVKALANHSPISSLRVRLVQVFKKKTGQGDGAKKWSFQNMKVEDATGSIIVVAKDCSPDFAQLSWEGQDIIISSGQGANGSSGAVTHDEHYDGEVRRRIRLTEAGSIKLADESIKSADESISRLPAVSQQSSGLSVSRAVKAMRYFQEVGQQIYPDSPDVAAAVGNTLFIALSRGALVLDDEHQNQT